jgi:hypothetical protein
MKYFKGNIKMVDWSQWRGVGAPGNFTLKTISRVLSYIKGLLFLCVGKYNKLEL